MPKGDIILVTYPYSDLSGSKLRPALVLFEDELDFTVSLITSQLKWQGPTDILLAPSAASGIKKTSLVRLKKIATIDRNRVAGKMGVLDKSRFPEFNAKLKAILQLYDDNPFL